MNKFGRREDRNRFLNTNQRISSAQNPFSTVGSVPVRQVVNRPFDLAQATKYAHRSVNLTLLKKHLFNDNLANLSLAAEVSNQRMGFFLDCDDTVESEMAEHIEKTIGLPAGWLDERREVLSDEEVVGLKEQIASVKREEEIEPPAPRVHLIRPAPAVSPVVAPVAQPSSTEPVANEAPQESAAQATQESVHNEPSQPRPSIAGYENSVTKENKVVQLAPELAWLNEELAKAPRGSRSKVAKLMGRNPNDLSAWLNGLRVMPRPARAPMLRALVEFDQTLGEEAIRRFGADRDLILSGGSEPEMVGEAAPAVAASPVVAPVVSDAPVAQPAAAPAAPVTAKASLQNAARGSEVKAKSAGTSTYVSFRTARNVVEIDAIALRTAQTLAEVVGSVMRRVDQDAEAKSKDTVSQG